MHSILIAEDEGVISEPICIVLRAHGYDVDVAYNGMEALELSKHKNFDLILLDIMMPLCNGIDFLKRAKLHKTSPKTKVIVLSNLAMGAEIKEALTLGAEQSILKASITPGSLLAMIQEELAPEEQQLTSK